MKYKVGDMFINTGINRHPYKVSGIKGEIYNFQVYQFESKTWAPSLFEWREEEFEDWTLISPVMRELYED